MADALARLLRLRAMEADAARRVLQETMRCEQEAAAREAASRAEIGAQGREVRMDAAHSLARAYAAWLPRGQAAVAAASGETTTCRAASETARAAFAAARLAKRACETLAEAQALARRQAALKREQITLDDSGRSQNSRKAGGAMPAPPDPPSFIEARLRK